MNQHRSLRRRRSTQMLLVAWSIMLLAACGGSTQPAAAPSAIVRSATAPAATDEPIATSESTVSPTKASTNAPAATSEATVAPEATSEPPAAPTVVPAATDQPIAMPAPSATAPTTAATGYTGYTVAEGDTLESIAAKGGSVPALIAQYNTLAGEPVVGRPLIVPQLAERNNTLPGENILVERGRSDKPWVALTLDAGASAAPVPQILQTLREHNVRITFFLTGTFIQDNPDIVRQIVADGHEIGNHSFNHPDFRTLDAATMRKEVESTEALLHETAGASSRPFFRPPYGAFNKQVLHTVEQAGFLPIYWTFDSLDSVGKTKTPAFLADRITGHLPPDQLRGAIILAHCGSQPTADALPQILDRFAALGFEVKKLSEVLGT